MVSARARSCIAATRRSGATCRTRRTSSGRILPSRRSRAASTSARPSCSTAFSWPRPLRSETGGSTQIAAIIGCGMSVMARPGDTGLRAQTDGFAIVVEGLRKRVRDFFFSQLVTRLTTVALQIVVLLAVGFFVFHFHFAGNLLYLLIVGIIGGGIFLAMGLAISGASKSEETAAPIANLVSLPLMFLSGIFFSRSNMPEWLQTITQYSPLTYVSDALRSISVDGASLWTVRTDLLGIFVWLAITVVVATRLFKWEVV